MTDGAAVASSCELYPLHTIAGVPVAAEITGLAATPTATVADATQPFAPVPVTVYMVDAVGEAVTAEPMEELSPAVGVHA